MKNNTTQSIKMTTLTGLINIVIAIAALTGCRCQDETKKANLDSIINNIKICNQDDSTRNYVMGKFQKYYSEVPMINGKVDVSKIDERYQNFLKLSNKERLKRLEESYKTLYSTCNPFSSVKDLSDREVVALLELEVSFYSIF